MAARNRLAYERGQDALADVRAIIRSEPQGARYGWKDVTLRMTRPLGKSRTCDMMRIVREEIRRDRPDRKAGPAPLHHAESPEHTGEHAESNTPSVQLEGKRPDDGAIPGLSKRSDSVRGFVYGEARPSSPGALIRSLRAVEPRERDRLADYKEKPISDEQQRVRYLESLLPDH